jgi:NADH-quinone oxidoreductase subunit G
MKIGQYDSKMVEDKNKKHKALDIGPHVMLDSERCILCTRCVRFCNEVSKSNELGIFNRGDHAELLPHPDRRLDNNYSVNTVDICPVGALTEKDFRFEARVWYLKQTDSICPGCSTGCNISVHANNVRDHHADGRRVVRLKPRYNPDVNKWWMCDFGRYSYQSVDDPSRITMPMLKDAKGGWIETSWEVAIEAAADKIKKALPIKKNAQVGIWASPQMTNEDLFVLRQFTQKLGITQIAANVAPKEKPFSDNYLIKEDKNPNTRGAVALGFNLDMQASKDIYRLAFDSQLAVLIIFHHDLATGFEAQHLATALGNVQTIIFIGPNRNATSEFAHILLPAAAWPEKDGTFTNFASRVQRIHQAIEPLGDARPEWQIVKRLGKELGVSVPYLEVGDVFAAIGQTVPAFAGLNYETVGSNGAMLKG